MLRRDAGELTEWLLAIPHYIIVGFFAGGGSSGGPGSLLVLIAGVVLLFMRRYPRGIFDFVLGTNRWGLRVVAYAGLLTDEYPPFRLDMGGDEAGAVSVGAAAGPMPVAEGTP